MTDTFRLTSVLKLRRRARDQAGKEVAEANVAIRLLDAKLQEIDEQDRSMDKLRRKSSNGQIDLGQLLDAQRFQMVLAAQRTHIERDRSLLLQELDRRQRKLVVCQQAVRSLEKLEEQHVIRLEERSRATEQSRLDEWSQVQHAVAIRREG
jgi:flagellar export protein FliJ